MHDSRQVLLARTSQRITLTNEVELEHARLQCLRVPDDIPTTQTTPEDLVGEMHRRLAHDDFAGALAIAEAILGNGPVDPDVRACADSCRARLMASYAEDLGSLDHVPVMVAPFDELEARSVDHRAGFLLSQMDGATSLEAILDVSGMPPLDALRIVRELIRRGIVVLRAS